MTDDEILTAQQAAHAERGIRLFSASNAYVVDRRRVEGDQAAIEGWLRQQCGEIVEVPGIVCTHAGAAARSLHCALVLVRRTALALEQ